MFAPWVVFGLKGIQFDDAKLKKELKEKAKEAFFKNASKEKCLLGKYLTERVFEKLQHRATVYGSNLGDVASPGLINPNSGLGICASDADCYFVFFEIFDPIIRNYHKISTGVYQPEEYFGDFDFSNELAQQNDLIQKISLECSRNLEGYAFTPKLTMEQAVEIQSLFTKLFGLFSRDIKGKYLSLNDISSEDLGKCEEERNFLRTEEEIMQGESEALPFFHGRGIFNSNSNNLFVWINKEDHLQIISTDESSNFQYVFNNFKTALDIFEKRMGFHCDDKFGFLTVSPANLGTTIHIKMRIKLQFLASNEAKIKKIAKKYDVQILSESGDIWTVENNQKIGITENYLLNNFRNAVKEIVIAELQIVDVKVPEVKQKVNFKIPDCILDLLKKYIKVGAFSGKKGSAEKDDASKKQAPTSLEQRTSKELLKTPSMADNLDDAVEYGNVNITQDSNASIESRKASATDIAASNKSKDTMSDQSKGTGSMDPQSSTDHGNVADVSDEKSSTENESGKSLSASDSDKESSLTKVDSDVVKSSESDTGEETGEENEES